MNPRRLAENGSHAMTTRTTRRTARVLLSTACATGVLLAGIALPTHVHGTAASWTGKEAASGSFSGATVPAPALTRSCEFLPGVLGLGARVRIYWQLPAGYQLDDVTVEASTSGLGSVLAPLTGFSLSANTTSTGNNTYSTDVPTNLLGGLLGLGSELEIAFSVDHDSGWRSDHASVATNAGLLAGIGGNCRNLT
ncbi:hypothetical protein DFO66_101345 [Brevibacterium sanguinis]|uniref:Uncharacterized protein n=2 Tax=Brevibacterium TaxID=1696 RepID=A0A366IN25_9MICO|nr:hypothetical protein DFO66_101345 [Brevibacterium sanguinis]RBP74465.1 hypothetical protein DFO65_101184 [Brevibacterium celere]